MTVRPSRARFTPDALSALIPVASPLTVVADGDFSGGFPIDQLSAYWNTAGDLACPQQFRVVFYVGHQPGHYGETYTFSLVSDTSDDFSTTPTTIFSGTVETDVAELMEFAISREQIDQIAGTDTFLGLGVAMTDGYPVGYIAFDDVATAGDEIDVDDGFGSQTITISGTLTADDQIDIDDGVNSPVSFVAKASGAVIASHEFNIGASSTDSATNLTAAIQFAITAEDLTNVTVSRDALVITVTLPSDGAVTEDTDAGNKIVVAAMTDFSDDLIFGTYDAGSLVYSGVMTAGDDVTIDDGLHDPVTFTFKTTPSPFDPQEVAVGSTATTSAQNLKAAIEAVVALGELSVVVSGATTTLTITNVATEDGFVVSGGTITEATDAGNKQAITDFTGVSAGVATGFSAAESAANLIAAINSGGYDVTITAFDYSPTIVGIVANEGPVGSLIGNTALVEDTDDGSIITVTDFAVPTPALDFWAYVAPCY